MCEIDNDRWRKITGFWEWLEANVPIPKECGVEVCEGVPRVWAPGKQRKGIRLHANGGTGLWWIAEETVLSERFLLCKAKGLTRVPPEGTFSYFKLNAPEEQNVVGLIHDGLEPCDALLAVDGYLGRLAGRLNEEMKDLCQKEKASKAESKARALVRAYLAIAKVRNSPFWEGEDS